MDDAALGPLFFEVHCDLPREGPGSEASTRRALAMAAPLLPEAPRIVDVGCGPGAQTLVLAAALSSSHPGTRIVAVDLHAPFLDQLREALRGQPFASSVAILEADMTRWSPTTPVDLVWCEGAAYSMGVEAALERWRRWLRPGGVVAFSDAVWLSDEPSPEALDFWQEYPAMTDVEGCRRRVTHAGYQLVGDFVLPRRDWWDDYYAPLERRLDALAERYAGDEEALRELAEHRREIALFEDHPDEYGYLFVVAAVGDPSAPR